MQNLIINIWKIMIRIKNCHILNIGINNGWKMSQKLPVNGFDLIRNIPEFDESFIKIYNEESDER